jgi:hypothetical protein
LSRETQEIVIELRNLGYSRTVVLYTNDNQVYRKLQDSGKLIKIVTYEQEQGGKVAILRVDLYFPKEHRKWLERILESAPPGRDK